MAQMTVLTLEGENNEEKFQSFYTETLENSKKLDVEAPSLPRKRKRPAKMVDVLTPIPEYSTASDMYKTYYLEAFGQLPAFMFQFTSIMVR